MDVAGAFGGRLGLRNWGMESEGLEGLGTRSRDLCSSVSVGCGVGIGDNCARVGLVPFRFGEAWPGAARRTRRAFSFPSFVDGHHGRRKQTCNTTIRATQSHV